MFISNFIDFDKCLGKVLEKKEDTRSATTNFGKEEYSKYVKVFKCLPEIPEAHILLYSPWVRGVRPRSLIKIETAIYIYIHIHIYI